MTYEQACDAVWALIVKCQNGTLFDDYDEGTKIIAEAERGLDALAEMADHDYI